MGRLEKIKKQIEELKKKTQELQIELEKEQEIEVVFPFNTGDDCFLLEEDGSIGFESWMRYHVTDTNVYLQGNVFKHAFQAEKERDRRILLTQFRHFRDKCNGDWKPFEHDQQFLITFSNIKNAIQVACVYTTNSFALFGYFKNKEDAERAVEFFGDEIKRLYAEE